MGNTKLWSVWHEKEHSSNEIIVKVKEWTEDDRHMKFRNITAKAAARGYIRNNLFGRHHRIDGIPTKYSKEHHSVKIEIIK